MSADRQTWVLVATGRARLLAAIAASPRIYPRTTSSGGRYPTPKKASLEKAAQSIPRQGLLHIKHLIAFLQVCESLRDKEVGFLDSGLGYEPGDRQMTPKNLDLDNPRAFVKPETLQRVIDRFNQAEFT